MKTIEQWEEAFGLVITDTDDLDLNKSVDQAAFQELLATRNNRGVNHGDRRKFLADHGYEVNRDNMVDTTLSARSTGDSEK